MFAKRNQTELTPTWPSLYDPLIEFHNLEHRAPIQPGGRYLTHAGDAFRFTFYWTLIFHSLFFLITGGIACFNVIYPSRRDNTAGASVPSTRNRAPQAAPQSIPMISMSPLTSVLSPDPRLPEPPKTADVGESRVRHARKHMRRSRVTYALFTLLAFLVTALAESLVESAVVGYVLWAVFRAARFNLST
ncbi:hypothetical protein F5148DRAFT_980267 [Russula earlei]|uniref:Uncharacterized protein n=1 Tax=Russula earlei TaxID=71964 RepID=A0ACC0UAF0_9AGAM|nr:hypothetical protein F5148DRAFT_980267 [Russula earlei]